MHSTVLSDFFRKMWRLIDQLQTNVYAYETMAIDNLVHFLFYFLPSVFFRFPQLKNILKIVFTLLKLKRRWILIEYL